MTNPFSITTGKNTFRMGVGPNVFSINGQFFTGSASTSFSDTFAGTGALDAKWIAYNTSIPLAISASRVDGRFQSSRHNTGSGQSAVTVWFNADRGSAYWQQITLPTSGTEHRISFINIGVTPPDTPTGNVADVSQVSFAGAIVNNVSNNDHEFLVAGHRGTQYSTLESKTTISNVSNVNDTGFRTLGTGITRSDIQVRIRSDGTLRWYYRSAGSSDAWTAIFGTGISAGGGLTFNTDIYVGIIVYGFDFISNAFIGVCDEVIMETV